MSAGAAIGSGLQCWDGLGPRHDGATVRGLGAPGRRLVFGSLFGVVVKGGGVILAFASQVVVARSLGVEAFGVYVTVIAWVMVLSLLGGFGLPLCAVRFLSVYAERGQWAEYRGFLRHAAKLTAVSSLAAGVLMVAVFLLVPPLRPILPHTLVGATLILLLAASALASASFLAAQMPLRADGLANVTRPLVLLVAVGALVLLGSEVGPGLALALTVGAGFAALLLQLVVLWRVDGGHWRGVASTGDRRIWYSSGMAMLFTTTSYALMVKLDTIMLGSLISPTIAGPYDAASRLAQIIGMAAAPVLALLGPMSAQFLARGDRAGLQRILSRGAVLASLLAAVLGLALIVLAAPLLRLFGPDFVVARDALLLLAAGQVVIAVCGPADGVLAMAGRNRVLVVTMLIAVVADIGLQSVLIPQFGMLGAAMATVLTLSGVGVALAVCAWRQLHVDTTLIGGLIWVWRMRAGSAGR